MRRDGRRLLLIVTVLLETLDVVQVTGGQSLDGRRTLAHAAPV
jgi:hypothetical protein